ncbi:hypothetical protein [Acetivibrio cellulolyticus]|uniref:hypothetical protein n=1 Tax=Acetivibrio cellulolyticus TaxID=35830 RepID=UPI0001E2F0AF|nr:hypothetical protein [Acetivibrio cellulolyticus]
MQLEGILFLLIILIIPIISIFSNDTAFFIILSLVLSFLSAKNILSTFFHIVSGDDDETKELLEEIEETIDLDFQKIEKGLKISKALVIILFFIYSTFFMDLFIFKIVTSFIIVYWLRYIVDTIKSKTEDEKVSSDSQSPFFEQALSLLINILSLVTIVVTALNKFF